MAIPAHHRGASTDRHPKNLRLSSTRHSASGRSPASRPLSSGLAGRSQARVSPSSRRAPISSSEDQPRQLPRTPRSAPREEAAVDMLRPGTTVEVFSKSTGTWVPARVAPGPAFAGRPVAVELVVPQQKDRVQAFDIVADMDHQEERRGNPSVKMDPSAGPAFSISTEAATNVLQDVTIRFSNEPARKVAEVLDFRHRRHRAYVALTPLKTNCEVHYVGLDEEDVVLRAFAGKSYEALSEFEHSGSIHAMMTQLTLKVQPAFKPYFLGLELQRGLNIDPLEDVMPSDQQVAVRRHSSWIDAKIGKTVVQQADFLICFASRDADKNQRLLHDLGNSGAACGPWGEWARSVTYCTDRSLGLGRHFGDHIELRLGHLHLGENAALIAVDSSAFIEEYVAAARRTKYGLLVLQPSPEYFMPENCSHELKAVAEGRQFVFEKGQEKVGRIISKAEFLTFWANVAPAIIDAARNGDEVTVEAILERDPGAIRALDSQGRSALHVATTAGYDRVALRLLEASVDTESRTATGVTPLHCAALSGHLATTSRLLDFLADIEGKDAEGFTPLHCVAFHGHESVVPCLLKALADVHAGDAAGGTALHYAVLHGHAGIVTRLVDAKADANTQTSLGVAALHCASLSGYDQIALQLLQLRADVHIRDHHGHSPLMVAMRPASSKDQVEVREEGRKRIALHIAASLCPAAIDAARRGDLAELDLIIREQSDAVLAIDDEGRTPLHLAARYGHASVGSRLLSAKADPEARDSTGTTPLHAAALHGHEAVVARLLAARARIECETSAGVTPLHVAALYGRKGTFLQLLTARADPEHKTVSGVTPLICTELGKEEVSLREQYLEMLPLTADLRNTQEDLSDMALAASRGDLVEVETLLWSNRHSACDVDSSGLTVLHHAACWGHQHVVERLLSEGLDAEAQDSVGGTPMHYAAFYSHLEVLELLCSIDADVGSRDRSEATALHYAALRGHEATFTQLLVARAHVDCQMQVGLTALHCAILGGHTDAVQWLLDAEADVHIKDCNGDDALSFSRKLDTSEAWKTDPVSQMCHNLGVDQEDNQEQLITFSRETGPDPITRQLLLHSVPDLIRAASLGDEEAIVQHFTYHGVDGLEVVDDHKRTALHVAVRYGHSGVVRKLLRSLSDVQARDETHCTPLHYAAHCGHQAITEMLLKASSSVEAQDGAGCTPFHAAARAGHASLLKRFIDFTPDGFECQDVAGCSALHYAALYGHEGVTEHLTSVKADVNLTTSTGFTPLHCAAVGGHDAAVAHLLSIQANPLACDNDRQTPLSVAMHAELGRPIPAESRQRVVKLLLLSMAEEVLISARLGDLKHIGEILKRDPNAWRTTDDHGRGPLHLASRYGHEKIAVRLLRALADVNSRDMFDATPLLFAAGYGHTKIISRLLNYDASAQSRDRTGATALHYAALYGQDATLVRLLVAGINVNERDHHENTPLHYASLGGHELVTARLLQHKAKIEARDASGSTPLQLVALFGYDKVVARLLSAQANIHARDQEGCSPLDFALKPEPEVTWLEGHDKAVSLLLQAGAEPNYERRSSVRTKATADDICLLAIYSKESCETLNI